MITTLDLRHGVLPLLILLVLSAGSAAAQDEPREGALEPERVVVADAAVDAGADAEAAGAEAADADAAAVDAVDAAAFDGEERVVHTLEQKGGSLGYSFVSVDGYGGRASEYGLLSSSPSGALFYRTLKQDGNFELEGEFLNEHDYHGDLLLDYKGDYRLHLRTESLHHNLDRELLFSPNFQTGRSDAPTLADYLSVQDLPANYGVSVTQDLAQFRYRLHNYPLHVNLGYWRLVREGTIQQRFADTSFEGTPNTIYAQARGVDRQTRQGRLGLDAHLGWVDLIYDFRVRVFQDRLAIPVANYVPRDSFNATPEVIGGLRQHNEDPDSRYLSHTVKLHTSLAGAVVGSASYSVDQHENRSRLSDTTGARNTEVTLHNVAGDFVYTPSKELSLALKYRRQELDNGGRGVVSASNFVDRVQLVKLPIDSVKDVALVTVTFKPVRELSLTGEYRGEYLRRSRVSELPSLETWALPESSSTQKGSLALLYRPVKGVRVTAKYSYATTDHPSYGNSFEEKHEGQFLTTYTGNRWGAMANLNLRREGNDQVERFLVNYPFDPLTYTAYSPLSRDRATEHANLGAWLVPFPRLTLAANYSYQRSQVDQAVLFTGVAAGQPDPGSEADSKFVTRAHVYSVNAGYAASEKLDLSLVLQQTRSSSVFAPEPTAFSAGNDTAGFSQLTEQETTIWSASTRGGYRFTSAWSSSLEYTLSDYNEKNPVYSAYNGTVHAVVAYLSAKW